MLTGGAFMNKKPQIIRPLLFFTLTYLLSWAIWIPLDLAHFGIGSIHIPETTSNIVRLLGVLMPAVSALILTAIFGGQTAVRTLLGRLAIWRVGWSWWAVAVLVQPILLILAGLIYNVMWGNPLVTMLPVGVTSAFVINIIFLAIATLGEEIGWRGVALPSLQSRRTALNASLILGFFWAAWHIPFWLLMDTFDQYGWTYMLLNFLFVLPGTFFITWFFNHSRSSLLLPVVFHLSFNILNTALFPVTATPGPFALFIAIEWLVTILIIRRLEPPLEKGIS
jgi:membrane protease YdiL (CAAX protease family)